MKKEDVISKWLDHETLTPDELETFKNLNEHDSYVQISDTAKKFKAPEYDVEDHLISLTSQLQTHKSKRNTKSYVSMILKVAAMFVLFFGIYFTFFYSPLTTVDTAITQKTSVELPDTSIVELNALSSIKYNNDSWQNNREISLEGEAFFKVAKGKKFDVETASGIVSVLGTQFNVKQRNNYFEVVCYEGLVSVTYQNNVIKLPAGNAFRVINNEISNYKTSAVAPDWKENRSSFKSTPYQYILEEFERQYNVTILTKNVSLDKLFTGNFVHSDIQTALQSITIPMHLKYEIKNKTITLSKE